MSQIETIEELVEELSEANDATYKKVVTNIDIPVKEFRKYSSWTREGYTRNCLHSCDDFELILLCWGKGAGSPIHGHAGQKCWVYQVEGNVEEVRFKKDESGKQLEETNRQHLEPGKLTYMDDSMGFHSIENIDQNPAMTLHIYIAPITSCKVLNPDKDVFETVALKYDQEHQIVEE